MGCNAIKRRADAYEDKLCLTAAAALCHRKDKVCANCDGANKRIEI